MRFVAINRPQMVIDVTLLMDMLVQFRTCYTDDGVLITNKILIAKRYFKCWFWFDLMCNMASFAGYVSGNSMIQTDVIKNGRVAKIIRLWKVLRVLRLRNTVKRETSAGLSADSKQVMKLKRLKKPLLALIGAAHIFACGWHSFTPTETEANNYKEMHGDEDMPSWMLNYIGDAEQMAAMHLSERYITCLYWAVVAVSTVGYGDICPETFNEQIYAAVVLLLGTAVFAFTTGTVTAIVFDKSSGDAQLNEKMAQIEEMMRHFKFAKELRVNIRKFCRKHFEGAFFHPQSIVSELPSSLQHEVKFFIHKSRLRQVRMLCNAPDLLLQFLMRKMERVELKIDQLCQLEPSTFIFMEKGRMEFQPEQFELTEGDTWVPKTSTAAIKYEDPNIAKALSEGATFSFFPEKHMIDALRVSLPAV